MIAPIEEYKSKHELVENVKTLTRQNGVLKTIVYCLVKRLGDTVEIELDEAKGMITDYLTIKSPTSDYRKLVVEIVKGEDV